MKNSILKLGICFGLSILIVAGLFALSQQRTHKDNGFYRLLPPHPVTRVKAIDLKFNSYYIAGTNKDTIYLSNYTAPLHLLKVTLPDLDTTHIQLHLGDKDKIKFHKTTRVSVVAPYVYIADGVTPLLLRGNLNNRKANNFLKENTFFLDAKPIAANSIAIQAISSKTGERILGKITDNTPQTQLFFDLLEQQIDGVFCTDGKLYHNKSRSQLIYVYNYRNQFIVMDTLLNLVYRGRTIDTTTQAKIKTYSIDSGKSKGLATKPLLVNRLGSTEGNYLFINSNLAAKNQEYSVFLNNTTIDIYNLDDRTYEFSFYMPTIGGSRLSDFIVIKDHLIAINNSSLLHYQFKTKTFDQNNYIESDKPLDARIP